MSATFDVVPVVEQGDTHDRHEVQLALTPNAQRDIIRAFCRALLLARPTVGGTPLRYTDMLAAGVPGSEVDEHQVAALDRVQAALGTAWAALDISPDESTALGHALLEAAEPPAKCETCGHVIDSDMTGNECRLCVDTPRGRRSA